MSQTQASCHGDVEVDLAAVGAHLHVDRVGTGRTDARSRPRGRRARPRPGTPGRAAAPSRSRTSRGPPSSCRSSCVSLAVVAASARVADVAAHAILSPWSPGAATNGGGGRTDRAPEAPQGARARHTPCSPPSRYAGCSGASLHHQRVALHLGEHAGGGHGRALQVGLDHGRDGRRRPAAASHPRRRTGPTSSGAVSQSWLPSRITRSGTTRQRPEGAGAGQPQRGHDADARRSRRARRVRRHRPGTTAGCAAPSPGGRRASAAWSP